MFSINYKKNKNIELYNSLKGVNNTFYKIQNYNPIYKLFFSLNDTNWNSINLNERNHLREIIEQIDNTNYKIRLENGIERETFLKYSPLIDPIRFLAGKLEDISLNDICVLPIHNYNNSDSDGNKVNGENIKLTNDYINVFDYSKELFKNKDFTKYVSNKVNTPYNTAYTESFFSYLSSQILNNNNFVHGVDFYGSFTCIKKDFIVNIADDLEALQQSTFFFDKCIGNIVKVQDDFNELINFDTRKNKKKIILNKTETAFSVNSCESFGDIFKNNKQFVRDEKQIELKDIRDIDKFIINNELINDDNDDNDERSKNYDNDSDSDSYCGGSNTTHSTENTHIFDTIDNEDAEDSKENKENKEKTKNISIKSSISVNSRSTTANNLESIYSSSSCDSGSFGTSLEDEFCGISIDKFPINVISLERLQDTLDNYMNNNIISPKEWLSILMQIIMTLLTYQKAFDFTHNDLHTNNIMYNETDKLFLYYKFDDKYYKVPTYGKIYKIIDFGRAAFKYNNIQIMCDAYNIDEDAYGQYNHEPFFDNTKPRVSPNFSFDLTRLGCSLFDHFIPDEMDIDSYNGIIEDLVKEWVTDDNGRNILYKSNGKERYPGFKLYKIIAKRVHKHTPENQLNKEIFKSFNRLSLDIQRELLNDKNILLMDIDVLNKN